MTDHDPETDEEIASSLNLINREEFYKMVWAEPVVKVAERFGVSNVTVAKWCKKMDVPRPGRGYWARKTAGHRVKQLSLPPPKESQKRYVGPLRSVKDVPKQVEDPPGLKLFECPIPVGDALKNEHNLISKTRRALEGARTDEGGLVRPRSQKRLDVRVSEPCVERALRIMNALVVALENAGYEVGVKSVPGGEGEPKQYWSFVVIDSERIFFNLIEKTLRTEREPTAKEKARTRKEYRFRGPFYDYQTTGLLSLRSEGSWHGKRHRMTWSDGKRQKLEDCLFKFVRSLLLSAAAKKRIHFEQEERQIRWELERQQEKEAERRRLEAARRQLALENASLDWAHATRIRLFLKAVVGAAAADTSITVDLRADLDVWLEWAGRYADAVDSLVPGIGVAERLTRIPEDRSIRAGIRDTFRQIEYDLHSISRNLSSLDSRYYSG